MLCAIVVAVAISDVIVDVVVELHVNPHQFQKRSDVHEAVGQCSTSPFLSVLISFSIFSVGW